VSDRNDLALVILKEHTKSFYNAPPYQEQFEIASIIEQSISANQNLIAKAGTGIGKTIAYLIPALLSGEKIVLAAPTLNLLDQIEKSTLPQLQRTFAKFDLYFNWITVKGRSNYLCQNKLHDLKLINDPELNSFELDFIENISSTGDKSDLPYFEEKIWEKISTNSDHCLGKNQCNFGTSCFYENVRQESLDVNILLTTHALYARDIAAEGAILPEHKVVIFDECHELPRYLRDAFSIKITRKSIKLLLDKLESIGLTTTSLKIPLNALDSFQIARPNDILGTSSQSEIYHLLENLLIEINNTSTLLKSENGGKVTILLDRFASNVEKMLEVNHNKLFLTGEAYSDDILKLIPLRPSREQTSFWQNKVSILVSATIPFEFAKTLGIMELNYTEKDFGTAIKYDTAALCYIPENLPQNNSRIYRSAINQQIIELLLLSKGRALVLFTSTIAMQEAYQALPPDIGFKVFMQGELPRERLLKKFTDDVNSSLFGTYSFWQGVDVPGPTCKLVIIDKIPFPHPDDRFLWEKREEWGEYAFFMVDIPYAAILLEQGIGRLLRSPDDKGVVAILDNRLVDSTYSHYFKMLLPNIPITRNIDDLSNFL
jgi:ATP-dependent DNA helicase DinG